jgi:hypothetical protein
MRERTAHNQGRVPPSMPPPTIDYATPHHGYLRRPSRGLFLAAQLPAVFGMLGIGFSIVVPPVAGLGIMATFIGSSISAVFSLCFFNTTHRKVGFRVAIFHACYLVLWLIFFACIRTGRSGYTGP